MTCTTSEDSDELEWSDCAGFQILFIMTYIKVYGSLLSREVHLPPFSTVSSPKGKNLLIPEQILSFKRRRYFGMASSSRGGNGKPPKLYLSVSPYILKLLLNNIKLGYHLLIGKSSGKKKISK